MTGETQRFARPTVLGSSTHAASTSPTSPDAGSGDDDSWLDLTQQRNIDARQRLHWRIMSVLNGPLSRLRTIFRFMSTTPGTMAIITVVLSVAIGAAGYSMSQSSAARQEGLTTLLTETEPLSYAAHDLYTNLSLADTIATSGFGRNGLDSQESLNRYYTAIDRASVAATQSSTGISADDPRVGELVSTIQRSLPVYTGMVEAARTQSRSGNPVGVTYTSNASAMMREKILPAAAELFAITGANVAEQQQRLTRPQWVPLSGLFAAVFFLVAAQWWLYLVTRRRLNRGFLSATAMMLLAIIWVISSNFATWHAGSKEFQQASQPWKSLTTARILVQQAQTAETLSLVNRQSLKESAKSVSDMEAAVTPALDDVEDALASAGPDEFVGSPHIRNAQAAKRQVNDARQALNDWRLAEARFLDALRNGRYEDAHYEATTPYPAQGRPATTANAAIRLDRALEALINASRSSMRSFIAEGLAATSLVSGAVWLLASLSILAVWLGIRARLQEYL